jgi:hypothetical protein
MIDFDRTGFYDATEAEWEAEMADNARRGNTTKHIPHPDVVKERTAYVR